MRRSTIFLLAVLAASPRAGLAQVGGNVGYNGMGGKARSEQNERAKRVLTKGDEPPTGSAMFVEANVLMNVKADEYVAVFGIVQDGEAPSDCGRKMDAVVKEFTDNLKPLGVGSDDVFVDLTAQTKIYGFDVKGDVADEKLIGFELKKNVSIHYKDHKSLDQFMLVAARSKIYDLIKVDYIVADIKGRQEKLMEEAAKIIKRKSTRYDQLLGIKLIPPAQVYAERPSIYYPTAQYDSYTAQETDSVEAVAYRQKYVVHGARKGRTFFFNGLDGDGFDEVINPVVLEPVVQFTLSLKVKYEVEREKAK